MPSSDLAVPTLPSWLDPALPFSRRVVQVGDHRVHTIDHGEGPAVLLMHGNPTWSFLWRKVIRRLHGMRVIAPDLVGFGLSDKPRRASFHSVETHVSIMARLVDALGAEDLVLVGQDWGGPIACGVGEALPDRVRGLVLANTSVLPPRRPPRTTAFHRFANLPGLSDLVFRGLGFPQAFGLERVQGDPTSIGSHERRAYTWPLRRFRDRAGPLALARMVPSREGHPSLEPLERIGRWVEGWNGPAALVWGTQDPILGRALKRHREALPQASVRVRDDAGHFLQEEVPESLADAIAEVVASSEET